MVVGADHCGHTPAYMIIDDFYKYDIKTFIIRLLVA